ncbi:MAG: hypothetical protein NZM12_02975 [Steroidobacteraceae bacterium]|nr:hypothetical protein [Steroidobacteraceae bacterium]MDW8259735.1 Npt1/Npt2 family nucleotide transporter [Gammaproteobacteria bacterium]
MSAPAAARDGPWWRAIERREWPALLACAGAYFTLLAGYYMLRSLREAYALQAGRASIDQLFYASFAVMLLILPLYWYIVARVRRRRLATVVYGAVIAVFAALAVAFDVRPESRVLAAVYFVAVTSLNLFLVTVFWSVMVDLWRSASAQRLFGMIAAGGSAGALFGPAFNALFVRDLGPPAIILLACGMLALTIALARLAQLSASVAQQTEARLDLAVGGRARDDLARLCRSPYLLAIASLIVAGQVIGAWMYNEQARYVEAHYATLGERAELFARLDFLVNVLALLLQTGIVGWLAARGGMRVALGVVPVLLIASLVGVVLLPIGAMLLATQVARRAIDYGLFKPTREMLFTVLKPESKFKSKSLIDTLLQRGGDSLGQGIYGAVATLGLAGVAGLGAGVAALMLFVALWVAARFRESSA